MDETTPLLPGQNDHNEENSTTTRPTFASRIVTILVWSSIIISALTSVYSLIVYLVVRLSPYDDYVHWVLKDCVQAFLPLSFICAAVSLFSIFKLTVPDGGAWLLVNLIFDPLIVFVLSHNPAIESFELADFGQCTGSGHGFPAPGFEARCERFAKAIKAAILVGLVFQIAILTLHLVFFIRDVVLGIKRFMRYGVGWRLPTGQFTVEFTVKILRQRDDGEVGTE